MARFAVCVLPQGHVYFEEFETHTKITVALDGVSPGKHGFYIHEYGDLTEGCGTCCAHFNPFNTDHGGRENCMACRHVGDLGNVVANRDGKVREVFTDHLVRLSGPFSVIGRSVVLHEDEDDLGRGGFPDSLTTGHAGKRIGCGVIGHAKGKKVFANR